MPSNNGHKHNNFNQMKEDNLISNGHDLSRENPHEMSFRVLYYGNSTGAVPFLWESQPGTPKKDTLNPSSLNLFTTPPLTPPPSYLTVHSPKTPPRTDPKVLKGGDNFVISRILPRKIASLKSLVSHSSSSSSSKSSSISSIDSISSPSSMRLIEHFELEDDIYKSPTSTLCFGFNKQGFIKEFRNRRARVNLRFSL